MYESQVTFTLDTVCPWTYVTKKSTSNFKVSDPPRTYLTFTLRRLEQALSNFRSSSPQSSSISYTLHFAPYQLNPDFPPEADRHKWYLENKHFGDDAAQRAFQEHMASVAEPLGIALRFDGRKGNTLHAHRVVQYFQDAKGAETASRLLDALYVRYFEKGEHPSTDETLVGACVEAGIPGEEARRVVEDKDLGLAEVKRRLREVSRDVDAVPVVVVEGRKRDITLIGAKEVGDYLKALEKIASESS